MFWLWMVVGWVDEALGTTRTIPAQHRQYTLIMTRPIAWR